MTCLSFLFDLLNNQNHHTLILSRGDHLINLKRNTEKQSLMI